MDKEALDYIIIGQGLAGSMLALELLKKNRNILVIDAPHDHVSSRVAAGLFNPITGRRVVKSWQADTLIPFANEYYRHLEHELNVSFFYPMDSLEVIKGIKEVNDWMERMEDPGIEKYFPKDPFDSTNYRTVLSDFRKLIRITDCGWMNISHFLKAVEHELKKKESLVNEKVNVERIIQTPDSVKYGSFKAGRIVYCQGYESSLHPLWRFIPFLPAKGELITIYCKELPEDFILLSGFFIIPLGNHRFRVGSTYEWNFSDEKPTATGSEKLRQQLTELLKVSFEIIDHHSGIRPTVKDRRPVLGQHPEFSNTFIFGGLGTKGVVLGPYYASMIAEFLEAGKTLPQEVNVSRFLY